ncbi:hypothetical protein LPJ66_002194 [Kickxella alabastrina]|uniref:Uncharacterized protein n=1 Tax=Kickxella alabastrina TaxID=61397 RepID=A0ACC1IR84_9FUNG|nr:hypothetical protein LPJ66_002194 [Kickxella alabastrina]
MSTAEEYSLLDSGRVSSAFDPMDLSRSMRPRIGAAQMNMVLNPRESPSLELLAEMIKEEIRQASSLKQALDGVGIEAKNMARRVSNMTNAANSNNDVDGQQTLKQTEILNPSEKTTHANKVKKQVQFIIPDDVRFRWLGIFEQPSDPETSDTEELDNSTTKNPTSNTKRDSPATFSNSSRSIIGAPARRSSSLVRQIGMGTGSIGRSSRGAGIQAEIERANRAFDTGDNLGEGRLGSNDSDTSSSAISPFTASSSVEAVYGGSRPNARKASMLGNQGRGASRLDSGAVVNGYLAGTSSQRSLGSEDIGANDAAVELPGGSGSKYGANSGKDMHGRIASRTAQPTLSTTRITVPKRYSVSPSFTALGMARPAPEGEPSASRRGVRSDDRLDSSQDLSTISAQVIQRSESAQSIGNPDGLAAMQHRRRNSFDGSNSSLRHAEQSLNEEYMMLPVSSSAKMGSGNTANHPDQQQQLLGGGRLFRRVTTSSTHQKSSRSSDDDHTGGGIIGGTRDFFKNRLRSRTHSNARGTAAKLTSAAEVHAEGTTVNGVSEYQMDLIGQSGNGGDSDDRGAVAHERPRRRSDVEVKSRVSPPPTQAAVPEIYPQVPPKLPPKLPRKKHAASDAPVTAAAAAATSASASGRQHSDRRSKRVPATAPSSEGHIDSAFTLPKPEPSRGQRKSHDDVIAPQSSALGTKHAGKHDGRASARTLSAEYTRQQSQRSTSVPPEPSIRLTSEQLELLRLRPGKSSGSGNPTASKPTADSSGGNAGEAAGMRSRRQRQDPGELPAPTAALPQPPRKFMTNVGRSSAEQQHRSREAPDREREEYTVLSPPPLPKMPPLPPIPPSASEDISEFLSDTQATESDGGHVAGDTDLADHPGRKSKSKRKTRRSSIMTTINSMLGRKE